jgi:hypothetical protein
MSRYQQQTAYIHNTLGREWNKRYAHRNYTLTGPAFTDLRQILAARGTNYFLDIIDEVLTQIFEAANRDTRRSFRILKQHIARAVEIV